jgi:hypothetical protein
VEDMMRQFWEYEVDPYRANYAVNDFCKLDVFNHLLQWVLDERAMQLLIDSGDRIIQPDREKHPPKRTEEDTTALRIINKRYTEQELRDKLKEFRDR